MRRGGLFLSLEPVGPVQPVGRERERRGDKRREGLANEEERVRKPGIGTDTHGHGDRDVALTHTRRE